MVTALPPLLSQPLPPTSHQLLLLVEALTLLVTDLSFVLGSDVLHGLLQVLLLLGQKLLFL